MTSAPDPEEAIEETPVERISRYLDDNGVGHEVVEHKQTFTAEAEAHASGIEADDTAKSVLVSTEDGYLLAVIPASARLDLDKVREASDQGDLRLATEDEMAVLYPDVELGALPAFGPGLPAPEIIDRRLLEHDRVLFNAGDHTHSVLVDPNDVVALVEPAVADICAD